MIVRTQSDSKVYNMRIEDRVDSQRDFKSMTRKIEIIQSALWLRIHS